ncbi:MAG: hypothetical protein ACP5MC_01260 [Candidatus Micrarchaeia archaeon]
MNKRVLLFGLLLLIIGIAISIASVSSTLPSSFVTQNTSMLEIQPNSIAYAQFNVNQTFLMGYASKMPVYFVFANFSAFQKIEASKTGIANASQSLEGQGVLEIAEGNAGTFPYIPENSSQNTEVSNYTKPYYLAKGAQQPGTYFAIFFNPYSAPDTVEIKQVTYSYAKALSTIKNAGGYVFLGSLFFLIGLFAIIASFFMSSHQTSKPNSNELDLQVQKLYDEIEKKPKGKKGKKKHRKRE